jgi:hypothetical protein
MSETKTLTLTKGKQLVDLNGRLTNFDLTFQVKSLDNSPFDVVVVDQTTLDNNNNLEFKRATGTISGNIVSDNNVYQNYFLCLKSENSCQIEILIDKKEIQPRSPQIPQLQQSQLQHSQFANKSESLEKTNWKMVYIAIVVIVGAGILYYLYKKEKIVKEDPFDISYSEPQPLLPTSFDVVSPTLLSESVAPPLPSVSGRSLTERLAQL